MEEREKAELTIEREMAKRFLDMANTTIRSLEKRVGVLEAQLEECRVEMEIWRPALPPAKALSLDPKTTALLVLDLTARCDDPRHPCHDLVDPVAGLLKRVREAEAFVVFTGIHVQKGRPEGLVYPGFNARPDEPLLYPKGYSKFVGGDLQKLLSQKGIKTVIVVGSAANFACLYTVTEAAQVHGYDVAVPVDGIVAFTPYEYHYALYQFTVLPGAVARQIHLTKLDLITFAPPPSPP